MRNLKSMLLLSTCSLTVLAACHVAFTAPKAFPSAEGYGSNTKGGRGGKVVEVTNLDDSGPGSLRYALSNETGPRTVVFRISGIIDLDSNIIVRKKGSFVTIAGQTAPGDGIIIKGKGLFFEGPINDIIVRHLRVMPGTEKYDHDNPNEIDCLNFAGSYGLCSNVIVDHCTVMWAPDENLELIGNVVNATIQWSVIAEGAKGTPTSGAYGMLSSYGRNTTASIHHNLFAHNDNRNPALSQGNRYDLRNNVVYDWQAMLAFEIAHYAFNEPVEVNIVGNTMVSGPSYGRSWMGCLAVKGTKVFLEDNRSWMCPQGCSNEWKIGFMDFGYDVDPGGGALYEDPNRLEARYASLTELDVPPVNTHPADSAYELVMQSSGATVPGRTSVEMRIVDEVSKETGEVGQSGNYPVLASGAPPTDSDHDGMPDAWEKKHGLDPNNAEDRNGDFTKNGYTNLEDYLNELAGDQVPGLNSSAISTRNQAKPSFAPLTSAGKPTYHLPYKARVRIAVTNIKGRIVKQMDLGTMPPGAHVLDFCKAGLPGGIYFVRCEIKGLIRATTIFQKLAVF